MVLKHSVELSSVVDAVSASLVTPCTLLSSTCLLLYPALSLCLLKGRLDCGDLTPLGAAISQKWMGVRGQVPQLPRPSREELCSWFFIISQSSPGGVEGTCPTLEWLPSLPFVPLHVLTYASCDRLPK